VAEIPQLGLVLDCHYPEALASLWAEALGYVILGDVENYVLLVPDGRPGPKLCSNASPKEPCDLAELNFNPPARPCPASNLPD
jgi:hypothetical protein